MRTSRLQRACPALAHLAQLVGAEDQGKAAALPYQNKVGRCCRNALIFLLLLAAASLLAQPVITGPPTNKTVRVGETAFFTVAATGTPPLTYQWRKDGADLLGATGATLALGLARPDMAGGYSVVVSNAVDGATSAPLAALTVDAASPGTVVAWGSVYAGFNGFGPVSVPVAAQSDVVAIAAGISYTVALRNNGTVVAWGWVSSGGGYVPVWVPDRAQSGVTAIAAAASHTVALKGDGSVVTWGWVYNGHGYVGVEVPVEAQSGVVAIAVGGSHIVALKNDGSVFAWGWVYNGSDYVPVWMPDTAQSGVTAIAAGDSHTVALKSDGSVVAWGRNIAGATTVPVAAQDGVIGIAAGGAHTVALKNDGTAMAWGYNYQGQVTGTPSNDFSPAVANPVTLGGEVLNGVIAVAAGSSHTVVLKNDGSVVAWGDNRFGQTTVPLAAQSGVRSIAGGSGSRHAAAVVTPSAPRIITQPTSQTVNVGQPATFSVAAPGLPLNYQWRKDGLDIAGATSATYRVQVALTNDAGSYTVVVSNFLGSVTSMPPAVLTVTTFQPSIINPPVNQTVNLGQSASFTVLAEHATTYQWRKNGVDLPGATGATCAFGLARTNHAGSYTAVASNPAGSVTSSPPVVLIVNPAAQGTVVAWGDNRAGQTIVPVTAQTGVAAVAAGNEHSVVLKSDGSVVTWGNNSFGQSTVPVAARTTVAAVAAGGGHSVVLKRDGSVVAWGNNGNGETTVPVAAQNGVVAVAAGGGHTVALKNDGSIVAWGDNFFGQTTVPLAAQSGVAAISLGSQHTVALKSDGSVVAWGLNQSGQTEVPIEARSGVIAIAAGVFHNLALKSDGSILAWGGNYEGQTNVPVEARSGLTAVAAGLNHSLALKTNGTLVTWGLSVTPLGEYPNFGQTIVPAGMSEVTAIAAGAYHSLAIVIPTDPIITAQPLSQEVNAGQSATFSVAATGFPPPSYQWRKDGVRLPGATNTYYELPFVQANYAGSYTVVVSNPGGSVTSAVATLVVRVFPPTITTQPVSQTVVAGDSVTFLVEVSAAPPAIFQWLFNGTRIPDATNAVLQLDNFSRSQAGNYSVVVGNSEGFVISDAATLTMGFRLQFASVRSTMWETGRVATIRVARDTAGPETVTVNYATSDGTATAGQDYTATSGTLTFGPGEAEKTFTIPILDDVMPERAEYLRLSLSGLTGPAVFGANTNAQVTILDDEQSSAQGTRARPVLAAANYHTVALKADRSLWAWGDNGNGQLGTGMDFGPGTNAPARVGSDSDWATVAVGESHTLAVKVDGSLWAWGNNCSGQLGVGGDCGQNTNAPARVGADNDWQMVAAGSSHSVGLKADGSVWAWGSLNGASQPAQIGADFDWAWIGAGWNRALAVKQDGTLWELYANDSTPIGTDNDWEMVVTGGGQEGFSNTSDVVALKSDGSLWSWGGNGVGQLGDGTTNFRNEPGPVGTDNDWAAVAAAVHHTLALKSDGSLWAWGANWSGQLGFGAGADGSLVLEPNRVGLDSDWTATAAGREYSIGLRSDGSLWTWGQNDAGQLGLGGEFNQNTNVPTRIGMDNDWALPLSAVRGEFRIVAQSLNPDHSRTLYFTHTNSRAYYVLYRGDSLTNITTPADAALASGHPSLTDRTPPATNATAFYRIRAVPRTQPLDLDHDGIDDYYELRHAAVLHPLNPADAAQDTDGDGYSNLSEYRLGSDPARPTLLKSIASGPAHTAVLKRDGSLWAWGDNTSGQLGDGTNERREQPVRIGGDNDWVSVSAGRASGGQDYTVAIKRDGSLWGWGGNSTGQLGFSVPFYTNTPVRLSGNRRWLDVSCGGGFTAAIDREGSLWVWGANLDLCCNPNPEASRVERGNDCIALAAGNLHLLALKRDHTLWAWGNNDYGQCGFGPDDVIPGRVGTESNWIAIAASAGYISFAVGAHSLGVRDDGTLWSWGQNDCGQLGLGTDGTPVTSPTRVGTDSDWANVAAGQKVSVGMKRDGRLWVWGCGVSSRPVPLDDQGIWREVSFGGQLTALRNDGSLWEWNFSPQTVRVPTMVDTNADWANIAAGGRHSLALKADGSLWGWGYNEHGELGNGSFANANVPTAIQPGTKWTFIAAGAGNGAGVKEGGTLWTWGANTSGQLGNGDVLNNPPYGVSVPQLVEPSVPWTSVVMGSSAVHILATRRDGSLWSWGNNGAGQVGIGVVTPFPYAVSSPQHVPVAGNWKALAGGNHTLAVNVDGTLWSWGANDHGQLGNGTFTTEAPFGISVPRPIEVGTKWNAVAAGEAHSLALREDGSLWAWGFNNSGQLGNGTFNTDAPSGISSPQLIQPGITWSGITAGAGHTVAIRGDGTLWAWGNNYIGQLGNGSFTTDAPYGISTPQPIQLSMRWRSVSAGHSHTLAIRTDGTLWAWGDNFFGQLGILPDLAPTRLGPATDWGSPP